jgi:uncharacterized circularly permuted ATP-grasp superfamily protein
MIDHVNNLKLQHLVELSKLGDGCVAMCRDIEAWMRDHDVVYGDQTIPFVLMPHFVSPGQVKRMRHAVASLSRVLERFCEAYGKDPALREELGLPDAERDLIAIDPGYPEAMRLCRLDAFLHGYELKFLEFNADSPAGMGYADAVYEGLTHAIDLPQVREDFDMAYAPMLPAFFANLLDAYRSVREGQPDLPESPRLALVDAAGTATEPEFRIVTAAARQAGIDAAFGNLDDLSYDGSLLRLGGEPVHVVYRRAMAEEFFEGGPLVEAMRDQRAAVVNPFRNRVANNKKLFALLEDPRWADLSSRDDKEVIRATIPWTRIVRPGRVTYGDWVVDLLTFVSDNRERLVLKPASDYGGRGVALGMETSEADWDSLLEENADRSTLVVQEYVPIPEDLFPAVEDGKVTMRLKRFNVNPFAIGGRYVGMLTRISDQAVINVSAGGGMLPSVVGRHKQRLLADDEGDGDDPFRQLSRAAGGR